MKPDDLREPIAVCINPKFYPASQLALNGAMNSEASEWGFGCPYVFDTEQAVNCIAFYDQTSLETYLNRRASPLLWKVRLHGLLDNTWETHIAWEYHASLPLPGSLRDLFLALFDELKTLEEHDDGKTKLAPTSEQDD